MIVKPTIQAASIGGILERVNAYKRSSFYQISKQVQENVIFSRTVLDFLGLDLPGALTELVARNWKKALEDFVRVSLFMVSSLIIPLGLIPIWNKISARNNNLPKDFNNLFEVKFEDLLPERDTHEENLEFRQKLASLEGDRKVEKFLGDSENPDNQKILELKKKLIKAKTDVVKMDVTSAAFLSYQVPWFQVWFGKAVLGVVGFTGELDYLSEVQREESNYFYEKTKILRYLAGVLLTFFGGSWYGNKIHKLVTSKKDDLKERKFLSFLRTNIKQFDYYKKIFSNRLNLLGTYLFGATPAFLLSVRSLNELIERIIRVLIFYPTGIWVDAKLHSYFAERHDKKYETNLIDNNAPLELGIKKVKALDTLEKELEQARKEEDQKKVIKVLDAIRVQNNLYWGSILLDAIFMGVGITLVNIWGTKKRVERGIY